METGTLRESRTVRLVPAAVWALYVLVASVVDPAGTGLATTGPLGIVGFDKWLHVGTYATLAFLVAGGLAARDARLLVVAAAVAATYGAAIELVQYPLASRSADVFDALANAVGGVLGVGAWTTFVAVAGAVTGWSPSTDDPGREKERS